jgi:PAS domain S-box-containing protein
MRYETKKSVRSVYNRLLDACDHTHELAGYPATINPDVKIYYAEETKDVRMMMKEATRGFDIGFGTSKNFEEHLRENNIDFDEFVRRIPGGVALFSVDPDIYPIYVSDTLAHMLGYSTKEYLALINKENSFGAVGEDIVLVRNKVKDAVEHDKKYSIVYRMRKKDGETLWIREQGSMVSSRNGHPLLISVFQNLSDMENVFGYVMDETQEGLIIRENETHAILYYNHAVSKLLKSVGPSASIESLSETLYDDHQEGNAYKLLYASHYLIIRLLKTEWFGRQAEMCYIIDCTSQPNRFMYLQEILSHVPAGIALYEVNQNNEVKCTYLSEQARMHCHIAYKRTNSLEDLMSIVHPDEREEATQKIYDAVVKRHPLDIELRVIGIDEGIYWDRLELKPYVENGRYYMYGVFTDVTELHHRGE